MQVGLVRNIEKQYSTSSIPSISNTTHCADLEPNRTHTNSELKLKSELQISAFNPHQTRLLLAVGDNTKTHNWSTCRE